MTELNKNLANHELMDICMKFVLVCHAAFPLESYVDSLNFKPDNPGQFAYLAFQAVTTAPNEALDKVGKTLENLLEVMKEKDIYFDDDSKFVRDLSGCNSHEERKKEWNAYMDSCETAVEAFELGALLGATSLIAGVSNLEGMGRDILSYLPSIPE